MLAAIALLSAQGTRSVPENSVTRVSDHVSAIIGFPNIAIVAEDRVTLVVDTRMGPRNTAVAAREARKLAKGPRLYLMTTHFHAEHATGEQAFPPPAILIRPVAAAGNLDRRGAE